MPEVHSTGLCKNGPKMTSRIEARVSFTSMATLNKAICRATLFRRPVSFHPKPLFIFLRPVMRPHKSVGRKGRVDAKTKKK